MIQLIPSLSVLKGKCVRIPHGDETIMTIYDESPLDIAIRFEEHGINRLHLIDLDGARRSEVVNYHLIKQIAAHTQLAIDFGGGVSTDGDVIKVLESGAKMVNIGSLAAQNSNVVCSWIMSYGRNKIIVSADVLKGKLVTRGMQKQTDIDLMEFIEKFYDRSLLYLKCADVEKDGTMTGPAIDLYKEILTKFPDLRLLASGGIGSTDDIKRLEDIGVYGAIIGKAYYEDKITLKDMEKFVSQVTA